MTQEPRYDEIGNWSEVKLDIIRDYATAYSVILSKQPRLKHIYIDAFAGAGKHVSKKTKEFIDGHCASWTPMVCISIGKSWLKSGK